MKTLYGFLLAIIFVASALPSLAQEVVSTIAFTSTRDNPTLPLLSAAEIYLIDYLVDGTFATPRRLTENAYLDVFPTLSPDGKERSSSTATGAELMASLSTPRTCS
jgi:hypothetical protein